MFHRLFSKKKQLSSVRFLAPISGRVLPLEEVPDPVFAQKMAGDGIAIEPTEGLLVAPVSGKVGVLFPTFHAISLMNETGLEMLIHIGIDTVKMNGEGFQPFVQVGDEVKAGDPLIRFDLDKIREFGLSPITPVIVTNRDVVEEITFTPGVEVIAGAGEVMEVRMKQLL
jgi:PTS system glucose-specific IIA component